jgi:hypothetical protein
LGFPENDELKFEVETGLAKLMKEVEETGEIWGKYSECGDCMIM